MRTSGYSILHLILVVVAMGILLALAAPSLARWAENLERALGAPPPALLDAGPPAPAAVLEPDTTARTELGAAAPIG